MTLIKIKSEDSGKEYTIDAENLTCNCPAFFFRGFGQGNMAFRCKHIKAFLNNKKSFGGMTQ